MKTKPLITLTLGICLTLLALCTTLSAQTQDKDNGQTTNPAALNWEGTTLVPLEIPVTNALGEQIGSLTTTVGEYVRIIGEDTNKGTFLIRYANAELLTAQTNIKVDPDSVPKPIPTPTPSGTNAGTFKIPMGTSQATVTQIGSGPIGVVIFPCAYIGTGNHDMTCRNPKDRNGKLDTNPNETPEWTKNQILSNASQLGDVLTNCTLFIVSYPMDAEPFNQIATAYLYKTGYTDFKGGKNINGHYQGIWVHKWEEEKNSLMFNISSGLVGLANQAVEGIKKEWADQQTHNGNPIPKNQPFLIVGNSFGVGFLLHSYEALAKDPTNRFLMISPLADAMPFSNNPQKFVKPSAATLLLNHLILPQLKRTMLLVSRGYFDSSVIPVRDRNNYRELLAPAGATGFDPRSCTQYIYAGYSVPNGDTGIAKWLNENKDDEAMDLITRSGLDTPPPPSKKIVAKRGDDPNLDHPTNFLIGHKFIGEDISIPLLARLIKVNTGLAEKKSLGEPLPR